MQNFQFLEGFFEFIPLQSNLLLSSFLDFLEAKFRFINRDLEEKFIPVEYNSYFDRNKLLAEFHGIDLAQMDREQREMMEELMRSQQHI